MTHIPRYLRPRPEPEPADPALAMLRAYGVTEYVPEMTTMTWTREGITLDVFVRGEDGEILLHSDPHGTGVEPVTVIRFFPHPKKRVGRRMPRG